MKKVAIVGGGISGLLSAFFLSKKGYDVTIFEKAKVGGKLQTQTTPHGMMESAANAILADQLVEEVCTQIGVFLIPARKQSKTRFIYADRKPQRWPLGFVHTLKLLAFFMKKPWRKSENLKGKTLAEWLSGYFPTIVIDRLFSPACQGIFGVGADRLSAFLIMNYFFNKEKRPRGKLRGSVTAPGGMGEIVSKLEAHLRSRGVRFVAQEVSSLSDLVADFNEVVVASDLKSAVDLLSSIKDFRGSVLKSVPLVDLVSINAFFAGHSPYPGFGILFPRGEGVEALGVLQNTYIFELRSNGAEVSETWIYGTRESSEEVLRAQLLRDRDAVFGAGAGNALRKWRVNHWPEALPLYGLELERVLENMPPGHPRVHLMGNYLGEIGLNRLFARASRILD